MTEHRVICADALGPDGLATLADKSVSHCLTDPPYEAEAHERVCRANTKGPGHGKSAIVEVQHDFPAITEEQRAAAALEIVRVTRGWVLVFCQIEAVGLWRAALVEAGAGWRRGMVWVKPDAMPQITGDRPGQWGECMALAWSGPGRSTWNGGGRSGRYEAGKVSSSLHPTQKPLGLMEALIADFTCPGDLLLDPYAGAGTTGVAARRLGRRFLGFEIDPKYHAIAEKRIAAAREQLGIFDRPKAEKFKQGDLLAASGSSGEGAGT